MLSFFNRLTGKRKPLPSGFRNYVELFAWYHPVYVPSYHLGLQIYCDGICHYVSFSPNSLMGLSHQSVSETRCGREAHFMATYADELVIQGVRNTWPAAEEFLTDNQKFFIQSKSFAKLSDVEILNITENFTEDQKLSFRNKGHPCEVITLFSLDIYRIVDKLHTYQTMEPSLQWASWSGSYFHPKNSHNCSSLILDLLITGGLNDSTVALHDLLTLAGGLVGATYSFVNNETVLATIVDIALGLISARCVGGAIEGYTGIQTFLNLVAARGKDNIGSILGLRIAFSSLSLLIGLVKIGPTVPALLALPRDVLQLAQQAKQAEESLYRFSCKSY